MTSNNDTVWHVTLNASESKVEIYRVLGKGRLLSKETLSAHEISLVRLSLVFECEVEIHFVNF